MGCGGVLRAFNANEKSPLTGDKRVDVWFSAKVITGTPLARKLDFHGDLRIPAGLRLDGEAPVHQPHTFLHSQNA